LFRKEQIRGENIGKYEISAIGAWGIHMKNGKDKGEHGNEKKIMRREKGKKRKKSLTNTKGKKSRQKDISRGGRDIGGRGGVFGPMYTRPLI
jgi:hypothetical protein